MSLDFGFWTGGFSIFQVSNFDFHFLGRVSEEDCNHGGVEQTRLPLEPVDAAGATEVARERLTIEEELAAFAEFGKETRVLEADTAEGRKVPVFVNEFWTAKQRAGSRLHEISYRACFKPQLPRFFIERLTAPGDRVYDPFMGRGTTCLEAALLGRLPAGCDINPLSRRLVEPRLQPPRLDAVKARLDEIDFDGPGETPEELLVFYHPKTLRQIGALRAYLHAREEEESLDAVDRWIRMVAINRLTGHSSGFFSVYTLPPNQAVSVKSQIRINEKRNQTPPERNVPLLIWRKSRQLLGAVSADDLATVRRAGAEARLLTAPAARTPELASGSVDLVVTSPPFLDVVDYAGDNWLRLWFCMIDPASVAITTPSSLDRWESEMTAVLRELRRVVRPGGHIAFEVGEVRGGAIRLEKSVVSCGVAAGLTPRLILINDQKFTKTANCWGVSNGEKGTNTNRIVLFEV